ncbi:MAG: hypothetical protein R2736_01935 [Solirubrobacterales bacterium]
MSQTLFPTLSFRDARAAIEFLERTLGAERVVVYDSEDGRVAHAEIRIGQSTFMCGDARPGSPATPPGQSCVRRRRRCRRRPRARAARPAQISELIDTDYGSRDFTVTDPEGNRWSLGTYPGAGAAG